MYLVLNAWWPPFSPVTVVLSAINSPKPQSLLRDGLSRQLPSDSLSRKCSLAIWRNWCLWQLMKCGILDFGSHSFTTTFTSAVASSGDLTYGLTSSRRLKMSRSKYLGLRRYQGAASGSLCLCFCKIWLYKSVICSVTLNNNKNALNISWSLMLFLI